MQSDYSMTIYMFSKCEHLTIIIIEQAVTTIFFIYLFTFCFYLKIEFKEGLYNRPFAASHSGGTKPP